MAVWYGIAIAGGIWPMALFGLLHLSVGIFLTHTALVAFFDTRRLVIENDTLSWKSGPIPTRGAVSVPVALVDGFAPHVRATSKTTTYVVALNLGNGTMRELAVDTTDLASTKYVVECFQKALAEAKGAAALGPYRG